MAKKRPIRSPSSSSHSSVKEVHELGKQAPRGNQKEKRPMAEWFIRRHFTLASARWRGGEGKEIIHDGVVATATGIGIGYAAAHSKTDLEMTVAPNRSPLNLPVLSPVSAFPSSSAQANRRETWSGRLRSRDSLSRAIAQRSDTSTSVVVRCWERVVCIPQSRRTRAKWTSKAIRFSRLPRVSAEFHSSLCGAVSFPPLYNLFYETLREGGQHVRIWKLARPRALPPSPSPSPPVLATSAVANGWGRFWSSPYRS